MKRRTLIEQVGAGRLQHGLTGQGKAQTTGRSCEPGPPPADVQLAGMSLAELRQGFHDQLFSASSILGQARNRSRIRRNHMQPGLRRYPGGYRKNLWFRGGPYGFTVSSITISARILNTWRWRERPRSLCSSTPCRKTAGGRKVVARREGAAALQRRHGRDVLHRRRPPGVRRGQRR